MVTFKNKIDINMQKFISFVLIMPTGAHSKFIRHSTLLSFFEKNERKKRAKKENKYSVCRIKSLLLQCCMERLSQWKILNKYLCEVWGKIAFLIIQLRNVHREKKSSFEIFANDKHVLRFRFAKNEICRLQTLEMKTLHYSDITVRWKWWWSNKEATIIATTTKKNEKKSKNKFTEKNRTKALKRRYWKKNTHTFCQFIVVHIRMLRHYNFRSFHFSYSHCLCCIFFDYYYRVQNPTHIFFRIYTTMRNNLIPYLANIARSHVYTTIRFACLSLLSNQPLSSIVWVYVNVYVCMCASSKSFKMHLRENIDEMLPHCFALYYQVRELSICSNGWCFTISIDHLDNKKRVVASLTVRCYVHIATTKP